jgi:ubiquinone biosynthesis protein
MFEELGDAFIKFGQMLAMRSDLVSVETTTELLNLLDRVQPFDGETAKMIVSQELGHPINEVFKTFDTYPVASASIGQVHKAQLVTGENVAVKIHQPEIEKLIKSDLKILRNISLVLDSLTHWKHLVTSSR